MGGIFRYDGPLMKMLSRIANLMLLSVYWALCCVPIVTIIPSCCALYHAVAKVVRGDGHGVTRDFFMAFKSEIKQGLILSLIVLASGAVLFFTLSFGYQMRAYGWGLAYLMIGILIYTSLYRKRGRLQDKIFFWLILSNMALAVGEWMSGILEFTAIPLTRPLMIACGTVSHIMFVFFSYLLYVYLDYATDPDLKRVRKTKILARIPCILFAALMILNLKTGWIFSIGEENVYHSGSHSGLVYLPAVLVLIFYLLSLVKVYRTDKRMAALGAALLVIRCIWEFWYRDISSTSFIYTLILESMHLYVMNRPLYEEVS